MKKSVTKNYLYNVFYEILVIILPILTTPYVSRVLGAQGIGIYSYTISITTYFILFGSLGIALYAKREIAYVQDDTLKRSKIFWEIILLRFITLGISLLIFYFTYASHGAYQMYYKILILEILANALDVSPFFQGMEEFKKIIGRNLIVKLISVISIFLFIKTENDVNTYLLIYALSTLIGNVSLWLYLPKYIKKIPLKKLNFKKHLKPIIILFIPQIATQIYTVLDKTMIGSLIYDKKEVGFYEQSQKIVKLILTIVTSLGTVMLPRIANKFANGKKEEIEKDVFRSMNFVYFLSIPMAFGLIAVAKTFIPLFLGDGFEKSIAITAAISPILLLIGMSNVIGTQFLLPTKRQKEYTLSVIFGALTNLILNFALIPIYKSVGASIATVIAEMVVTLSQIFYIRKIFNVKKMLFLIKNYLISGIIMLGITLLVLLLPINSQIILLLIQGLVGVISYFGILLLLKDEFLKYIIKRAKSIIKK